MTAARMEPALAPGPGAGPGRAPADPRAGRAGAAAVGALLVVEGMVLAARFDTDALAASDAWWLAALSWAGQVTPLALAIATAIWMLGDPAAVAPPPAARPRRRLRWIAAHLCAFGLLYWLTTLVFESPPRPGTALAWVATGVTTYALGAAAMAPPTVLLAWAGRLGRPLGFGVAVGAAAWAAGHVTEAWWDPLRGATFHAVRVLLELATDDAFATPAEFVLGTSRFAVEIAPICSGYQGIGLVWVFVGAYLWFFRDRLRFPHALLLLPIGTVTVWLANAVRVAALVLIGSTVSPALALGGFHAHAGSLLFCAVALGLVAASRRSAFFDRQAGEVGTAAPARAEPYLIPLLLLLVAGMAGGALAVDAFQPLYPLRVLVAAGALWAYRRHYAGLGWPGSWTAVGVGAVAFALWLALVPASGRGAEIRQGLEALPAAAAALWTGFRVIGAVVIVPLVEELAFRGYLLRRLVTREFETVPATRFAWGPFLVSSFLFGALHDAMLAGTVVGMLYALAFLRRGRLGDAVLAHATTNALIAIGVLAGGRWDLWA